MKGKIEGLPTGTIYLAFYNGKQNKPVDDSSLIINGEFHFSGSVDDPTVAFISLEKKVAVGINSTEIFLEHSVMSIELVFNHFNEAHLTGSQTQDQFEKIRNKKKGLEEKISKVLKQVGDNNKGDNFLLKESLNPYYDSLNRIDYEFFSRNPTSYLTLYLLQYHLEDLPGDSLALFYNRLRGNFQKSPISKRVTEILNNQRKRYGVIGTAAATFIGVDNRGKKIGLDNYKGKYVLLDFWASWCIPCRKNNPHLKKIFQKNKDKGLIIIGIADDSNDPAKWAKAILKDGIDLWPQVLRKVDKGKKLNDLADENDINDQFGIQTLPTSILINPEGIIIGRFGEKIEEVEKTLTEIFKSQCTP